MQTHQNFSVNDLNTFQESRAFLLALSYRFLGSIHDAEDIVQDVFIKWLEEPKANITNPQAWLTSVCTRQCIDLLRSAHKSRTEYIGTWLPEPYDVMEDITTESDHTLSTAFLLLLEKLSAKERAAYLLHDIFELDYSEVATIIQEKTSYCRQLVTRARQNIQKEPKILMHSPATHHQIKLLNAFRQAVHSHNLDQLTDLLTQNIVFAADGGGKVSAIRKPMLGQAKILRFFERLLFTAWNEFSWKMCYLNGNIGFKLYDQHQACIMVLTFGFGQNQQISNIYVQRNPDKIQQKYPYRLSL
ncbi:sigma-70 family RNA polymerase sigma factor [Acinetobacter puyangensis]|uniref:sigma-70 family RNA polymerase sigma factor n=1 Tax=Acinetobacter puyangensis TaxID=1096779 RepID=UPI003A4DF3C2